MPTYCPFCGGRLIYDSRVKLYTCQSCGVTLTLDEIVMEREKLTGLAKSGDMKRKDMQGYLKWWLSSKKQVEES
jgi:DNA-directed RNA polymerase subunit RPC12/RpoP